MKNFLLAVLLFSTVFSQAQTSKPQIGSDKGVKETFIKIKKGLPDIKNNLTVMDKQTHKLSPKIGLGNDGVYNEPRGSQTLTFTYTPSGYSGTAVDYQNYYRTLVSIVKEVFGAEYTVMSSERGNLWRTALYENGKNAYTSTTGIYIKYDGTIPNNPAITVEIASAGK